MSDIHNAASETVKSFIDVASILTVASTIMGYLPQASAVLTFIWLLLRIYETMAFQHFLAWMRQDKDANK